MKKKIIGAVLMIAMVLVLTLQTNTILKEDNGTVLASTNSTTPKYIFYFIGDGLGTSQRQIAEYYLQETTGDKTRKLTMNIFPHSAINTTHSLDTLITDSAAAGTALATGHKTNNGVIAKDAEGNNLKTLIEGAEEKGMATGLVTTTRITHATPAVFASHNESRGNENDIAADYLDSGIDYIVGGGVRHFLPTNFTDIQTDAFGGKISSKRKDDRNILAEFIKAGYKVRYGLKGAEEFRGETLKKGDKYLNLFTTSHLPYTIDDDNDTQFYVPSLADITDKGIELLSKDEDGFFFMIEGGRIDHACHPNDPSGTIMDTLAFDKAIEEAYKFYEKNPHDTLIVVVGDHETGGLGMGVNTDYFLNLQVLENAKMSIEEFQGSYTGNRETYYRLIEEKFGLTDLTKEEKTIIDKGMDMVDKEIIDPGNAYKYDEAAMAVTHVLSERAGVYWTSYAHTATQIPMSAIGVGAQKYNGFLDNTDIAEITAKIAHIELN
ncbi:alkaline phosphatase [Vallitalea longa]|uniref:Alkaline phosphatase n=1 Tax=Vallitalea longa TaxID=2936439 RepID=A0A9W5Y912_9FIRM|nr:alkaline phosphatase [Vallitalea longa]GKX28235.1 alkaline phosphatase [Vallitalea longa]